MQATCADDEQLHQLDIRQAVAQRRGRVAEQVPPEQLQLRQLQVQLRVWVEYPVHVLGLLHIVNTISSDQQTSCAARYLAAAGREADSLTTAAGVSQHISSWMWTRQLRCAAWQR